ncbi:MAG: lysophospholipase [Clostridiales bacterium]|jgi:alpha-beta hydrolase superfamily lysophospholipase|nr:lysophospholipase [Clostridiales bacterium]
MKKRIGKFMGVSGVRLCMQSWKPDDNADVVAAVILMHGGNNYCDMEMYNKFADTLVGKNYAVYSFDQRGFGRSEGRNMHMESWHYIRGDFSAFIRLVQTLEPGKPLFAFGISFGACQVIDQAIVSPHMLNGIIAASFSTRPVNVSSIAVGLINVLGGIFPKLAMKATPLPSFKDAETKMPGTNLWEDPLCPRTMTLAFTKGLFKRQEELANDIKYLTIPMLHLQGADDTITLPDNTVVNRVGTKDYTYKEYPKTGHEVLMGGNPDTITKDILHWLDGRIHLG